MMRSRDEQREEQRRYEDDVSYDVWRNGGNPDRVNDERVTDGYYDGRQAEDVAREEHPSGAVNDREDPHAGPTIKRTIFRDPGVAELLRLVRRNAMSRSAS